MNKRSKPSKCLALPLNFVFVLTRVTLLNIVWCSLPKYLYAYSIKCKNISTLRMKGIKGDARNSSYVAI